MKKIIVCNKSSVEKKYASVSKFFWLQIDRLIAAGERIPGNSVILICVDDATTMSRYGLTPVTSPMDEKQNKDAVDGIFQKILPDCMVIIGAQDLFPFQALEDYASIKHNYILSDLPYSCTAPYSKQTIDFLTPSRMVTRLPDLYGANETFGIDFFIKTVDMAISVYQQPISEYNNVFCLYAKQWESQTSSMLSKLTPATTNFKYSSPDSAPPWDKNLFAHNIHLINLHGEKLEDNFYGQLGGDYPVAITSSDLINAIDNGTVAVVLCCFGGQLFNIEKRTPFVNTYLSNGAVMLASTVVAYTGPAEEFAEIFLNKLRDTSKPAMQKALLETRLDFISKRIPLDAVEQKTVAEFVFYGDCGISYINASEEKNRVLNMKEKIDYIRNNVGVAVSNPQADVPAEIEEYIEQYRIDKKFKNKSEIRVFDIEVAQNSKNKAEFEQTKQYLVSMTDENNAKHTLVYTFKNGVITNIEDYIEK